MTLYWEIGWNRWNSCVCIESMTLFRKRLNVYWKCRFSIFIQLVFHLFICGQGLQSRPASALTDVHACIHTHTQNECLFNGLGASGVMISPESRPPRAKGTPTAALPQVGQHGTTELGRNSCPPTPWEVKSAHWMDGSGVLDSQQDLSIHLPWHLIQILHLLLPYHLPLASHQTGPLSCALTSLYIHQQHYIHMIHWALKASKTAYKNHFIALWNVKFLHFLDSVLTRTTSLIICSNV